MVEPACEFVNKCDNDQQSFKTYLTRWMAATTQVAGYTSADMLPLLQKNGQAAAAACTGSPATGFKGLPGTACGYKWTGGFDGLVGVGEQMNALSALMYNLVAKAGVPLTATSGGSSIGDPSAGFTGPRTIQFAPITIGDRVAGGFLTTAIVLSVVGGSLFVIK